MVVFIVDASKLPQSGHGRQARGAAVSFLLDVPGGRKTPGCGASTAPGWFSFPLARPAAVRRLR